jgi:hypothetical protein
LFLSLGLFVARGATAYPLLVQSNAYPFGVTFNGDALLSYQDDKGQFRLYGAPVGAAGGWVCGGEARIATLLARINVIAQFLRRLLQQASLHFLLASQWLLLETNFTPLGERRKRT